MKSLVAVLLIAGLAGLAWWEHSEKASLAEQLAKAHKRLKDLETLQQKEKGVLLDVKNALTARVEKLKLEIASEQQIIDSLDARLSREKNLGVGGENPQVLQESLKDAKATQSAIEGQLRALDEDHKTRSATSTQASAETRAQWTAFINQLAAQAAGEDAAARETQSQIDALKGKLDFESRQTVLKLKTELSQHKAAAADLRAQKQQYQAQQSQSSNQ